MKPCPCGSGQGLDACCGAIIAGAPAPTAEALMRSRYTAFVLGDLDHIEATHAPEVRGDFNRSAAESVANDAEWLGLDVRGTIGGGADDQEGEVEFVTNFMRQGKEYAHHEIAVFRREQGNWMYVKGRMNPKPAPRKVAKVGRNEPCPCGSGRKFKKCCGA
ncbi:MAG: YchJ family protein [Rhodospirillales bacterium]|nr:YchJ family protein [Rhodospirillales bacterium]